MHCNPYFDTSFRLLKRPDGFQIALNDLQMHA